MSMLNLVSFKTKHQNCKNSLLGQTLRRVIWKFQVKKKKKKYLQIKGSLYAISTVIMLYNSARDFNFVNLASNEDWTKLKYSQNFQFYIVSNSKKIHLQNKVYTRGSSNN